jgi:GNAT superfamily N-acetyltransferase
MVSIRFAEKQDAKELSLLSAQLGYPCSAEKILEHLEDLEQNSDHVVFVAEGKDQKLAGFVHVFKTKRIFLDPFAELGGLVVDKEYRNTGVGKALLERSETWAREYGCQEMRVRSNVIRKEAHQFYSNLGYLIHKQQAIFLKSFE